MHRACVFDWNNPVRIGAHIGPCVKSGVERKVWQTMQHPPGTVAARSTGADETRFRWTRWLVQGSIVVLVVWGIWRSLASVQADLVTKQLDPRQFRWPWFVAAAACYFVAQFPTSTYWHEILVTLGQPSSWTRAFRAFFVGHLGKYVPSKLLVVAIRAALVAGPRTKLTLCADQRLCRDIDDHGGRCRHRHSAGDLVDG